MSETDNHAGRPLGPPVSDGIRAFFERERDSIIAGCTRCGRCAEACPMVVDEPSLAATDAKLLAGGVLGILRGEAGTQEALAWVQRCMQSGECDVRCPEPISPKMMLRVARITCYGGLGDPARIAARDDPDFHNKVHAFARLQLTSEEREEWTVAPIARLSRRT